MTTILNDLHGSYADAFKDVPGDCLESFNAAEDMIVDWVTKMDAYYIEGKGKDDDKL